MSQSWKVDSCIGPDKLSSIFAEKSLVLTPEGYKHISDLKKGNLVITTDSSVVSIDRIFKIESNMPYFRNLFQSEQNNIIYYHVILPNPLDCLIVSNGINKDDNK